MYTNSLLDRTRKDTRILPNEMPSISNGTIDSTVPTSMQTSSASFEECQALMFSTSGVDGLTTAGGVPTRTTPTLTPTLLKNIEESFLELQCPPPLQHQHQAGFVPPLIHNFSLKEEPQDWLHGSGPCLSPTSSSVTSGSNSSSPALGPSPSIAVTSSTGVTSSKPNRGGRRPNKIEKLTPEEEERRRVRRERNKLAAARCRKRRLDHTNLLLKETEGLEETRRLLENQVDYLKRQKDELELVLESHRSSCKYMGKFSSNGSLLRSSYDPAFSAATGLDSLMDGSGGSPVAVSTCSSQQRSLDPGGQDLVDMPDIKPPKLVSL